MKQGERPLDLRLNSDRPFGRQRKMLIVVLVQRTIAEMSQ